MRPAAKKRTILAATAVTRMPFDFGGGADMYASTVGATEGLKNQLKSTFGWTDARAYARMGISGMNGPSGRQEVTTPRTWTRIRDYATSKGLARFTFPAVNRDRGCPGGGVVSNCSGIAQADWEFTRISAGFRRRRSTERWTRSRPGGNRGGSIAVVTDGPAGRRGCAASARPAGQRFAAARRRLRTFLTIQLPITITIRT